MLGKSSADNRRVDRQISFQKIAASIPMQAWAWIIGTTVTIVIIAVLFGTSSKPVEPPGISGNDSSLSENLGNGGDANSNEPRQNANAGNGNAVETGIAREYTIVANDDISCKALTKNLSSYTVSELRKIPMNVRKRYHILVSADISRKDLRATLIKLVEDETSQDPDIDQIAVFVFDRKADVGGGNTAAILNWCPNGKWGNMTPEIARSNDRSTYKFDIEMKATVGDSSGRPTEREFRISEALEKELQADPDTLEDTVKKRVAASLNITVEELFKIWLKVTSYKLK